jgi:hypothetical protein
MVQYGKDTDVRYAAEQLPYLKGLFEAAVDRNDPHVLQVLVSCYHPHSVLTDTVRMDYLADMINSYAKALAQHKVQCLKVFIDLFQAADNNTFLIVPRPYMFSFLYMHLVYLTALFISGIFFMLAFKSQFLT